ncbi:hypothetical protein D3C87_1434090 [compost metagenome]
MGGAVAVDVIGFDLAEHDFPCGHRAVAFPGQCDVQPGFGWQRRQLRMDRFGQVDTNPFNVGNACF